MQHWFTVTFKKEKDHSAFLAWLPSWESENESAEAKIRFVRCGEVFSVWTLHTSDANFETLFHAAEAFNGVSAN